MISRRGLLKSLTAATATTAATGAYATVVEPGFRLVARRWQPGPASWPPDLRLRIVALADVHMGPPHTTPARLEAIVAQAAALRGDLVVLLGDYRASHRFVTERIAPEVTARLLRTLGAPLGAWAILGNHDWWDDAEAQRRRHGPTLWHAALGSAGIPVLDNEAVRLTWQGQPFWLAGLASQLAFSTPRSGADDLGAALAPAAGDAAPVILLAHEPHIFPRVPPRVALTLCGHTHGGQVRLLGYSPVVPSRFGNRYAYGHVVERGRHLVVSGGLGCSIAPIRFGVPPEITVVELGAPPPS
jgi:predicted MPP superfamily phosphohydrolase